MGGLIDIHAYPVRNMLARLLRDHTTGEDIRFATDAYVKDNAKITGKTLMTEALLLRMRHPIEPRVRKTQEKQMERKKKKAEVFTPAWLCNRMNNYCDEEWFGRTDVFNKEVGGEWIPTKGKITFPEGRTWREYVDSPRLEITCGEAPYIVSRYDAATGSVIPTEQRSGLLDRKIRIVNENAHSPVEWFRSVYRAFRSVYGYEYQGDNLLVARINLLMSFCDYVQARWERMPTGRQLRQISDIITRNFWQMDGRTGYIPFDALDSEPSGQLTLFALPSESSAESECMIYDWKGKKTVSYNRLKRGDAMKFDFVIGNPPYQQEAVGTSGKDMPVYHYFLQAAIDIGDRVELITPARFLFNAGGTPKEWNETMLQDHHFKVLKYEANSSSIFMNTDIRGGVAVTYYDRTKRYKPIGVFTACAELESIRRKVWDVSTENICSIITNRGIYRYSDLAYDEQQDALQTTTDSRLASNCFDRMPSLFLETKPDDGLEYIQIYGNIKIGKKAERVYRWFRKDYLIDVDNLYKYKVLVPKANGSGAIGEALSTPLIGTPLIGFTETYISIGATDRRIQAEATLKYVKTKFARVMLGILKVTQNNAKPTWKYVPLQDFTSSSDIDWSQSVSDIDKQLYKKYKLSQGEIDFVESHVKEMA